MTYDLRDLYDLHFLTDINDQLECMLCEKDKLWASFTGLLMGKLIQIGTNNWKPKFDHF